MTDNKNIFPAEIAEYSAEYHFQQHNTRTLVIYQVLIGFVVLAFILMFIIKVDVSVNSMGIIRPVNERDEIKAPVSGRVDSVFIKEGSHVKAGQVLVKIKSDMLQSQDAAVQNQQTELANQLEDLQQLVRIGKNGSSDRYLTLKSAVYSQQYKLYWEKIKQLQSQNGLATREFNRYQYLFNNHVLSAAEFDKAKLNYENARNALTLEFEGQRNAWQIDLNNLKIKSEQLGSQQTGIEQEKDAYILRASVSGTVQDFKGVQPGSFVTANELVAEISPDSGMIAESYVSPKDIGLIKVGTKGNFQVDAYNYNEWGMVKGKITSISADVTTANGQPYFKVRSMLEKSALQLKNGVKGNLKKGMTLQVRFFVTRRSLFQLLHDKADDWLNPNVQSNDKPTTAAAQ